MTIHADSPSPDVCRRKRERGASLVELTIGTTFVITVLVTIIATLVQQSRLRRVDEEIQLAMVACRNNLEEVRDLPFSQVAALNGQGFDVLGFGGEPGRLTPLPGDADSLPGHFVVSVDKSSAGETLYDVKAEVDWTGVGGRQHFEFRSLVAERKGQ